MFLEGYHTKEAHEKRPNSNVLNTQLIFQKQVLGRVINFDEKSYIKTFSKSAMKYVLLKLQSLMQEDFDRFFERDHISDLAQPIPPSSVLSIIVDTCDFHEFVKKCVFEKGLTFTEAFQFALKVQLQREREKLNRYSKHVIDHVVEYARILNLRFASNVRRVLLDRLQRLIKEDFIFVLDHFMPEIFFQPSDYLKGIIYRKNHKEEIFNHFSVYYQIPILHSQEPLSDGTLLMMDVESKKITLNPNEKEITSYLEMIDTGKRSFIMDPFDDNKYKIHSLITNYRDVRHLPSSFIFQRAILYYTDVVVAAKGTALTEEEWGLRIGHIFRKFKGEEVLVRLPGFDEYINIEETYGRQTSIEMFAEEPEYYEPLLKAIATVYKKHLKKKVTIVVPHLQFQIDHETFQSHIRTAFKGYGIENHVDVLFECGNEQAMFEVDALRGSEGILINLDYLAVNYIPDFMFSRDPLTRTMLFKHNIFADLQYTRYTIKNIKRVATRHILSGFNLQIPSIFHRLLIAGYRELVIPIQTPYHFIDEIEQRIRNKGKYAGVYEKDRERTLFYRDYKEKNNYQLGQTRPHNIFKKLKELEEKEKEKEKEEEEKEKEEQEKEKENQEIDNTEKDPKDE